MLKTLVSIIVPNYNHAAYLKQRLACVYNQTYPNFEVILLDDASTDHSAEQLKQYEHNPKTSQLIINSQNSGSPFRQWQKGIELAKGEFIWIAESDDFATVDFLEKVIQPLLGNKNIGLSYCQSIVVDENSDSLYENTEWTADLDKNRWKSTFENNGIDECKNYLIYKNTIPNASAVVFRKSLIKEFPIDFKLVGDWYFWISILLKSDVSFFYEPLNFFRTHQHTSRKHDTFAKKQLRIEEGMRIVKLLEKHLTKQQLNERVHFHYQWFLKILPINKLLSNIINPCNSFVIPLKYPKIVTLTFNEIVSRLNKKIKHA